VAQSKSCQPAGEWIFPRRGYWRMARGARRDPRERAMVSGIKNGDVFHGDGPKERLTGDSTLSELLKQFGHSPSVGPILSDQRWAGGLPSCQDGQKDASLKGMNHPAQRWRDEGAATLGKYSNTKGYAEGVGSIGQPESHRCSSAQAKPCFNGRGPGLRAKAVGTRAEQCSALRARARQLQAPRWPHPSLLPQLAGSKIFAMNCGPLGRASTNSDWR